ncbi:SDR family oxidoreductase [Microbulbifer sp. OS29]|uniref:SDR family oxidoreductase n=1 Tax=Microbulbifer okhotskensis TaxID=2926617 RepID=A0A9X2J795_9GAMM|nr:SDR family oxidoreductase [Microbulbifer okhotskensis]MCO1336943.1 SDR family oxidoreductase [Microbulbifer okhotskensis]
MLSGKQAIITGGSDGIGFEIAKAFAKNNSDILIIARNEERLKQAKDILSEYDVNIEYISADLSDVSYVKELALKIRRKYKEVDVLVNNAGVARFIPFSDTGDEDLDLHLNLNVKTPYILTRELFSLLALKKGSVINISSYFSHRMLPGRPSTAYSMSKGAIDSFTKSLAYEAGIFGVRVNAIAPGTVNTPLVQENIAKLTDEEKKQFSGMIKSIYPLGRIGEPQDISGAAVFLASDHANWVTGEIMAVDGGLTTN